MHSDLIRVAVFFSLPLCLPYFLPWGTPKWQLERFAFVFNCGFLYLIRCALKSLIWRDWKSPYKMVFFFYLGNGKRRKTWESLKKNWRENWKIIEQRIEEENLLLLPCFSFILSFPFKFNPGAHFTDICQVHQFNKYLIYLHILEI